MTLETLTFMVASIAALGGAIAFARLAHGYYYRPVFDFTFPDGSRTLTAKMSEERRICIHIENQGRKAVKTEASFVYFPSTFQIKSPESPGSPSPIQPPIHVTSGRFANYQYIAMHSFYFATGEVSTICVGVKLPEVGGQYKLIGMVYPIGGTTIERELTISVI